MSALFFTSASFCGCDPAYEIGESLLIMFISTVVYQTSSATSFVTAWGKRLAVMTGYASMIAAVLFGTVRTIDNLQRLF